MKKRNPYLTAGLVMTGILTALIVMGVFWTPYDPNAMAAGPKLAGPSLAHLMGTDGFGRDIFSRVLKGAGTTYGIALCTVAIGAVCGTVLGAVTGYFRLDAQGVPCLIVKEDGLNQTILQSFLDEYRQTAASLSRVARENPDALPAAIAAISRGADYTQEFSLSAARPSATVNYYYALLAMVCLYGSFTGMDIITYLQANLSPLGARRSLAPVKKMKMVLADLLSGFTIHSACLLTTLAYIALVLRVDFGPHFGLVLLTCLAGSLVGVSLGALLSAATRLSPITKTGLLVSLSMVCCFLAGLMMEGISYQVAQNAPAVAWLNPAARIADAFYCLYYFDTYHRFFLDIGVLLAMAAALFGGAVLFLRRRKYESI